MDFTNTLKEFVHSKILCPLSIHDYVNDNGGISSELTLHGINYYHCRYCPKFKLNHLKPVPISFIKLTLKQKILFELNQNKKEVLVEKFDFHPRITALRKLKKVLNQ